VLFSIRIHVLCIESYFDRPRRSRARSLPTSAPETDHPSAPEPSSQTCVGSLGITCEIDDNLDILRSGGGTLFRRRLKDLVETYLPNVETPWRYVELNSTQYFYPDFLMFKCLFGVLSEIKMRLKRSLSLRPCKGSLEQDGKLNRY
jgi:hypothetical protein